MTVINPNSISGITSITLPSGGDNVLTIHTNDGTERFRIDSSGNVKVGSACTISQDGDVFFTGVCTATTLSGAASGLTGALPAISAANLTNVPAANITGTLPAISAANLTNVPAANITGTLPAIDGSNLTGIGGTDFIHAEQISVSGVTTSQAFIPSQGQLSHRNLIINGDMSVAQRGTSSTSTGYTTVDRITTYIDNIGVTPTYSQVDVTSGGAYNAGFRKAFQVTKGAGTANAASQIQVTYKVEARDIAKSGWNYTDPNSFITFSFWVKSSVSSHNPQVLIQNSDTGTSSTKFFVIDVPALTANTWTKITQAIPGHANQVYNNDNGNGFEIQILPWYGTDYTDAGNTTGAWTSFGTKPVDSTWLTTNSSTFQITGLQLEVGQVATPFEHRSFGEELALCQRYYYIQAASRHNSSGDIEIEFISANMRATPTATRLSGVYFGGESSTSFSSIQTLTTGQSSEVYTLMFVIQNSSDANCGGKYAFDAEL